MIFFRGCDHCEEWYHGDCIHITEKDAKYIKRYYCKKCRRMNPELSIVYKSKYKEKRKKKKRSRDKDRSSESESGRASKKKHRHRSSSDDSVPPKRRNVLSEQNSVPSDDNLGSLAVSEEDAWEPDQQPVQVKSKSKSSSKKKTTKASTSVAASQSVASSKRKRGRRASGSESDVDIASYWDVTSTLKGSRQCYGHKCTKEARVGSKYCSENCGINLASLRIMQTLPDRIREWNMNPCEAEKRNRRELETIRAKQEAVKATLEQLNRDFRSLEELIAEGKSQVVEEPDSDDEDDSVAVEMTVHCVTCGSDVQTRTAIRHMERCYNKIESQTSFASRFKTQIEDERMFCDFYDPKHGTYCKRLQVLCPEHNPDDKRVIKDDEVCGYPIQKEVFGSPTDFCRASKKACQAHYSWEKLRRAELDMERVKQWMKVDELLEQERQVRAAMSNRAGVLGLLLHSTFNHELEEKLRKANPRMSAPGTK